MRHPGFLFALIPVFVILALGGMWVVIPSLLARLGGWSRLAERFRASHPPNGKKFRRQSIRLNSVRYNNCLTIYVSGEGLYLRMTVVFRTGHPDLLIPWQEIHDPVVQRILWTDFVNVEVARPTIARLRLSNQLFKELPEIR